LSLSSSWVRPYGGNGLRLWSNSAVVSWANGLDLHLDRSGPVRAGLEDALRAAVRTGRLAPGLRLPPSRALAADLGVARNTVADAYGQLVAEGWLVARPGSGTRVADRAPAVEAAIAPAPAVPARPRYDLRPGSPDVAAFPRTAWLAAARKAVPAAPSEAFGYGDPRGRPELRAALAGYLARARGVRTTPDRIVVCSGFVQGVGLLCSALLARGASVLATEAFGVGAHRAVVAASGLAMRPLPVDAGGADVAAAGGAGGMLLTPAHQFPLGVALAPARRTAAVGWAADTGGVVIEDDYDGEFRYDRQPVAAMQALAPEQVVYAGTASKSLAPGLRLAWLALPGALLEPVVEAKRRADAQTGVLDQLTLAEFLISGGYDRQVRRRRLVYRRRRDRLLAALPGRPVSGIAAGLHAVLELPGGLTEAAAVGRGADHGLALDGLDNYAAEPGRHAPALVVGYGTPPDHAYTSALARLAAVLRPEP
jgi:GntR family transcriptional regulator / MocR family aminotransferase